MTSITPPEVSPERPARPARVVVDDVSAVILLDDADLDPHVDADLDDDHEDSDNDNDNDSDADTRLSSLLALVDAVAAQQRPPQRIVVVGLDPDGQTSAMVRDHAAGGARIPLLVRAAGPSRREQVEAARTTLPVSDDHWLWFLAVDSGPERGTLASLVAAARRSTRVGVVGPKLVRGDEPRLLRSLGHHLTPAGRLADPAGAALVDQGQLDLRQDVLGVPLAGALVSSAVLEEVGGIDPAFGADGVDGLDLGWRSHLAGHRVVVAPDAILRQGEPGLGVRDPVRTRIRTRQLALARGSAWAAPWRALGVLLTSLLAALVLLLVKRPHEAAAEWADVRAVLSPGRGWGARRRFRSSGARRVRPRDLAGLHAARSTGWRDTVETVGEALDPRSRRTSREPTGRGGLETGPVAEELGESDGEVRQRRWWSWPLAAGLLAIAAGTAVVGRGLWGGLRPGGPGLTGGELGVAATDAAGLWASATQVWRGGGLGHDHAPESWLAPAAALTGLGQLVPGASATAAGPALAWLLALAPVLAVASAYLALRRVTRRRWLRVGLSMGYATAAPLLVAVGQGRVGPVVVHVLAPLLLGGLVVVADRRGGSRRAAAAFALVLGVSLAAQWVPGVAVLGTAAGAALLVLGRGSARWRGAVLAVLPWLLLLPMLPAVVDDPVRLAGGAGATSASALLPADPQAWRLLLLDPAPLAGAWSWTAMPLWSVAPVWLAALGALALPGRRGRRAGVLVCVVIVLLAVAGLVTRTSWGVLPEGHPEAGLAVVSWAGTALSLAGAGLLLAAALLVDHLLPERGARRDRRWWLGLGVALVVVLPAPLAALRVLLPSAGEPALSVAGSPLPAVAAEQARGPAALRTLTLATSGAADGALLVDLQGAEPEPARILRDRAAELAVGIPEAGELESAVDAVAGGVGGDEAGHLLRDLGVGYVLLEGDGSHPVVADLDRVSGLTRVSSPVGTVLWRMVEGDPARIRVLDADGTVLTRVPSTGPHGSGAGPVEGLPDGAVLDVAEGAGWERSAIVRVDGSTEVDVASTSVPLPEGDHELEVTQRRAWLPWHLLALALGLVTAFLALPFGRSEREQEEAS